MVDSFSEEDVSAYLLYSNTFDFVLKVIDLFSGLFVALSEFFTKLAVKWFPVLEELHIDLSWLLIDFSRIFRTIFNLLQFTILFMISRGLRQYIRNMFRKETDWSKIRHF